MAMQEKSKFVRFLSGKGFYIALALLVVGAGATTWVAIDKTVTDLESSSIAEQNDPDPFAAAGQPASDVPREESQELSAVQEPEASQDSSLSPDSGLSGTIEPSGSLNISYAFPVDGDIINPYSAGELVKSATLGDWRTHDGIDIAASAATPVYAVAQGVVSEVYDDPMFGMTVKVEHPDGVVSVYQSLNETVAVEVGQSVAQGDVLGSVGETALAEVSLPTHLHFAMTKNGEFLDPLDEMAVETSADGDAETDWPTD